MRVPLLSSVLLLALAAFVAGCGGPDDPNQALKDACKRQIEQIEEESHESGTPTAKSTEERLSQVELQECAGQDLVSASPGEGAEEGAEDEGGDETEGEAGEQPPAEEEPAELDPAARDLFNEKCGSCHVLADAGSTGAVGPNLDESTMDAAAIEDQIVNGGGAMPPALLQGDDAKSVAEYVAAAAGAN